MARPSEPRLPQIPADQWDESLHRYRDNMADSMNKGDGVYNIFKTLAGHPPALKRWMVFANHVLYKSTLTPRDREILILRIGWKCQAEYEWAQHVLIGKEAGLSDEEIDRIKQGPGAPGWSDAEVLLLRASDELHSDACIQDDTWAALKEYYNDQQMVDIVLAVGNYNLVSMLLNSLGVPLDDFLEGF